MPLIIDDLLNASEITHDSAASDDAVLAGLNTDDAAGYALIAAERGLTTAIPALALTDDDTLAAQCAAWAPGRLADEATLIDLITGGSLDQRENGYRALGGVIATQRNTEALADAIQARLDDELERARGGRTGLCEHATRLLAMLGVDGTDALIQSVIDTDPYTDRFELQRQRKALESDGSDRESMSDFAQPWLAVFADHLAPEPEPVAVAEGASEGEGEADAIATSDAATDADSFSETAQAAEDAASHPEATDAAAPGDDDDADAGGDASGEGEGEDAPPMIDWEAFAESSDAAAMDEQLSGMIMQLGPALEQLALRAAGVSLLNLSAQELAGLILQVLPQALPPQVVQAALSPEAINGFQAMARWLDTQPDASGELVEGIRLVRGALQEQVRASGMLGGPDYSEPEADEA